MAENKAYEATIKEEDGSLLHIEASIPWEAVEKHRSSVVKEYGKTMKVDGFRQGHVPETVVLQKINPSDLRGDMAELAIKEIYPLIITDNNLEVIGHPHITITKLAEKNPLEFKAHVAKIPTVELPDYKALAKEVNKGAKKETVEDKEVEDAIKHIQTEWTKKEKMEKVAETEGKKISEIDSASIIIKDEDLPALDDAFAQKIGPFKDAKDFKEKLTENILKEKQNRAKDKRRGEILEKIRSNTKLSIPDVLIDAELNRMMTQFQADVERLGMQFDEYIKHSGKKIEDMRVEWKPDAEKYAKNQMILNKIAIEESFTPDEKLRDEQVEALLKVHKDAEKERVVIYVETVMTNDLVLEFLENQK